MACDILVGRTNGGNGIEYAVFFDTVTMTPFGTMIGDLEEAESFQDYMKKKFGKDLRQLSHAEFLQCFNIFIEDREAENGN